jgi:hypothetical protein
MMARCSTATPRSERIVLCRQQSEERDWLFAQRPQCDAESTPRSPYPLLMAALHNPLAVVATLWVSMHSAQSLVEHGLHKTSCFYSFCNMILHVPMSCPHVDVTYDQ